MFSALNQMEALLANLSVLMGENLLGKCRLLNFQPVEL
jgi:hypothetical protein